MRVGLSLRLQFLLTVCSLIIILMVGVLSFVYYREREILQSQVVAMGNATALNLAASFRDQALQLEYSSLQQTLPRLRDQGVLDYGEVIDDEHVLASSDRARWMAPSSDDSSQRALAVARLGSTAGPFQVFRDDGRYLEFSSAILESGPGRAVVVIGYDTSVRIDSVVSETQHRLLWIFLVATVVGAILAFALAGAVVSPIGRLAHHAQTLALSEYGRSIELESGAPEIRTLTTSLNYMREKIKAHIDELDDANQALDRKVFELRTLFDVAETMNFKSYSPELLSYILDTALRALDAEWGSLWLYNSATELLEVKMVRGAGYDRDDVPQPRPGQGIAGQAFQSGKPVVSNEGARDPRFVPFPGYEQFESLIRHIVCVPLLVDNEAIGVINLVNKRDGDGFDDHDVHLLSALASQAARALEHAKLYDLAIRESKTGLFIPRYFQARLHEQVTLARRYKQSFSVLITDIDHFKQVNDRFGHLVGDEVIIRVSRFLTESLRENIDIASRWGGEEFSVILPRTDREGSIIFSERFRRRVESSVAVEAQGIPGVTVSVGVATFPEDGADAEALVKAADDALYRAKRGGRNRVCHASQA